MDPRIQIRIHTKISWIRNTDLKQIISPPKPSSKRRRGPASVRLSREPSASLWKRTSISARAFTTGSSPTVTWAALCAVKNPSKQEINFF
jgi:hypothetical protein